MFSFLRKSNVNAISVHDIDSLIGKIDLIDIRETYEYKSGHLPTSQNIPMDSLLSQPEKYLDKEKEYYIICQSGGRSSRACSALAGSGYKVVNVSGGTGSYLHPLER